jgi:uncharacterized protein
MLTTVHRAASDAPTEPGPRGRGELHHLQPSARARARVCSAWIALLVVSTMGLAVGDASANWLVTAAERGDLEQAFALLAEGASVDEPSPDGTRALHWAVYNGQVELVRRLVAADADVTAANDYGATPMSEAAVRGDVEILELLLDGGADPDSPNVDGQTALMVVARTENVAAAKLLLDRGANVNAAEQRKGQTALMWAAAQSRPGMIDLLLAHDADVDARSIVFEWERRVTAEPRDKDIFPGGFTALLFAARQGCTECVRSLLDAGAEIHRTNPEKITPLLMALLNGHFDAAKLLVERGADVNQWDLWGRTPLYAAVDFNTLPHGGRPDRPSLSETTGLETIALLLESDANPNAQLKRFPPYRSLRADRGADGLLGIGATPLIRAARAADIGAIELLLEHGALVDLPQERGITALMVAAGMDRRTIDTRGKFTRDSELLEAAKRLLGAGADVARTDDRGRTALHAAASQGMNDAVRLLVESGADPLAKDDGGFTPLDTARGLAAGRRRGPGEAHDDTAQLLAEIMASRGADRAAFD